jgi:hypothetical protein
MKIAKYVFIILFALLALLAVYYVFLYFNTVEGFSYTSEIPKLPIEPEKFDFYVKKNIPYYYNIELSDPEYLNKFAYSINNISNKTNIVLFSNKLDEIMKNLYNVDMNGIDKDLCNLFNDIAIQINNKKTFDITSNPFASQIMKDVQENKYTNINKLVNDVCRKINFNDTIFNTVDNGIYCIFLSVLLFQISLYNTAKYINKNIASDKNFMEKNKNFMQSIEGLSNSFMNLLNDKVVVFMDADKTQLREYKNPIITCNAKQINIEDKKIKIALYYCIVFIKVCYELVYANIIEIKNFNPNNIDFADFGKQLFSNIMDPNSYIKINENNLNAYMKNIGYESYMKQFMKSAATP